MYDTIASLLHRLTSHYSRNSGRTEWFTELRTYSLKDIVTASTYLNSNGVSFIGKSFFAAYPTRYLYYALRDSMGEPND